MKKLYFLYTLRNGLTTALLLSAPAHAATTTYWGPHGGVVSVHPPYAHPLPGPCCYAPWRGAMMTGIAVGSAIGAATRPYPYTYAYPGYLVAHPIVYPPAVILTPPAGYIYPVRPMP